MVDDLNLFSKSLLLLPSCFGLEKICLISCQLWPPLKKKNKKTVAVYNRLLGLCLYNDNKTTHNSFTGRGLGLIKPDFVMPSSEIVRTAACILLPGVTSGIASFVLLCCVELNQNCLSWKREKGKDNGNSTFSVPKEGEKMWICCVAGWDKTSGFIFAMFQIMSEYNEVCTLFTLKIVWAVTRTELFFLFIFILCMTDCFDMNHPGFSFLRTDVSVAHRLCDLVP